MKKWKGSSTVEMAFLIPLVTMMIILLLSLGIFLYNRSVLTAYASAAALRGSRQQDCSNEEIYNIVTTEIDRLVSCRLLFLDDYEKKVSIKGDEVTVTLGIEQKIPLIGICEPLLKKDTWSFAVTKTSKIQNPVFFIRNCKKVLGGKHDS